MPEWNTYHSASATGALVPTEPPPRGPELDVVFCVDCTGSMGSYIKAAKKSIGTIARTLVEEEGYDLRVGVVAYRDYNDTDGSGPFTTFPFTSRIEEMEAYVAGLSASGGRQQDGAEAVEEGLRRAADMEWRTNIQTKICILIGDAPPHGLGEWDDDYPDGPPTETDVLQVLDGMAGRGIVVYAVGCEPTLSTSYEYGVAFWVAAAEKTFGRAIALGAPSSLPDVVIGGLREEMDLEPLLLEGIWAWTNEVRQQHPDLDDEDVQDAVYRSLCATSASAVRRLQVQELHADTASLVAKASTLQEARLRLRAAKEPEVAPTYRSLSAQEMEVAVLGAAAAPAPAAAEAAPAAPAAPTLVPVTVHTGEMTRAQFDRMYKRAVKQGIV
jgi:hypothetical protein